MHCASQYASVGQYIVLRSFCAGLQNRRNSAEVRGSGHEETNARACLKRVNVPKSFI